jgi:hypothetical protein
MDRSYTFPPEDALAHFGVEQHQGLSERQVQESRKKYGPNGLWSPFLSFSRFIPK